MSLNILLIDDEYVVLKGLETLLLEQSEIDLQISTAMDAIEASEKLKNIWPDVIITDINMPEIDGLTFLEQVQESHPACKFIIISGYEETEYLKRALHLHVADYLLKPVDKAYLIKRLAAIYAEKIHYQKHTLLKIQFRLYNCGSAASNTLEEEELIKIFPYKHLAICTILLNNSDAQKAYQNLCIYFEAVYTFTQNEWHVFLLNYSTKIQESEIIKIGSLVFNEQSFGISLFPGEYSLTRNINDIFHQYHLALCDMILNSLPVEHNLKKYMIQRIASHTLNAAIKVIMFEYGINDYISETYENDISIQDNFVKIFTESLTAYIYISNVKFTSESILQLFQTYSGSIQDKKKLYTFMEKTLNFWYESFSPVEQEKYSSKINAACKFIEENYSIDLSLEQAAEIVTINPSYLSYIFKKETGITFVQYLTNIRMHHACRLMTEYPALSLDEVARKTGYNSTSYFHKIFRAKYGLSPRQWLQKYADV